jgi:4-amino-4-deoxy-L-arabinose transferase-like glycosyltransferase
MLYLIVSLILTLTVFRNQNDFLVYFEVGEVFVKDINNLYNANYLWPFRYFPISAVFFVPFYLLGFDIGFVVFNFMNLFLNILICILLYKTIFLIKGRDHEEEDNRVVLYLSLFLLSLPNLFNYILGQINLYVTFLVLLSLYIFLKHKGLKWELLASIILGLSINIKPITIFMIPFLVILSYNYNTRKFEISFVRSIVRLGGSITPIAVNLLIFIPYPQLFQGFLEINFTGSEPIILNHSFSLSKLIVNFCIFYDIPYNPLLILISLLIFFGGIGILIYIFRKKTENSLILGYVIAIVIMLLAYFDSWPHHLLILSPILIVIIFLLPRNSKLTRKFLKPIFFFISFFDLLFMGIWFGTQNFFPFNFMTTIFLILTFYCVCKALLTKNSINQNI